MGTNYYEGTKCETCGHVIRGKHIGKSSVGWTFALHVYPDEGILDLSDWVRRWRNPTLFFDEYGDAVAQRDLLQTILLRIRDNEGPTPAWYEHNNAVPGPLGMARRQLSGSVIGYGDGTYDLVTGDFT